jgi:hypothetical protein
MLADIERLNETVEDQRVALKCVTRYLTPGP